MFSFKNLLNKAASAVSLSKDQVLLEGSTGYLYFDIQENNQVVRHRINTPTPADIDASAITSGVFDIARIPRAALERLIHVPNQAARFELTADDVDLGDTVQQDDTGVMYIVVNLLALDSGLGYQEYTAGSAASVPWGGITNKPEAYQPVAHTHTVSEITDLNVNSTSLSVTLQTSNWVSDSYTITNQAISANTNGYIDISPSATLAQEEAAIKANLYITSQTNGSIVLEAGSGIIPTIDIPIIVTLLV